MQEIGLAILYLTALAAYLSLGWVIWCAGRWLYRNVYLMHPTYGEADRYARKYLIKPHPLWEAKEAADWAGKRPTTASHTKGGSLVAQKVDCTIAPILPFSRSAPLTTPTIPAGQHSPFAVRQDVSPPSDGTPAQGA